MFLDIIQCLVFCLKCRPVYISKHNVSETGFYLRPQVKPTLLGTIDRASPHLRTNFIMITKGGSYEKVSVRAEIK
jgi:hypothetical protein